jgi:hypothetical protein
VPVSFKQNNEDLTIISAHLDSVNQWNPYWGRSPGADDGKPFQLKKYIQMEVGVQLLSRYSVSLWRVVILHQVR